MDEYAEGVDLLHLASEMVIDAIVQPEDLRAELVRRFARYAGKRARVARQAQRRHAGLGEQRREVDEDAVVDDAAVALAVDRRDRDGDRVAVLLRVGDVRLGDGAVIGLPALAVRNATRRRRLSQKPAHTSCIASRPWTCRRCRSAWSHPRPGAG